MGKRRYNQRQVTKINTKGRIRFWLFVTIIAVIWGGLLNYPKPYNDAVDWINDKVGISLPYYWNMPFKLGLDLQGGTHLVYSANVSDIPGAEEADAIEGVRDVIERRVNSIGVSEPLVQTTKVGNDYRVIVELAGITDINEAINLIGETPLLEFREENTEPGRGLTPEEQSKMDAFNASQKQKANETLLRVRNNPGTFADVVKNESEDQQYVKDADGQYLYVNKGSAETDVFNLVSKLKEGDIAPKVLEDDKGFSIIKLDKIVGEKEIEASHILICYEGAERCSVENPLSKEDAQAKAQELKNEATPANFEQLAKDNSTEPGADQSGGSLGKFKKGVMVPPFEDAVFKARVGSIIGPVETQFGYHVIYKKGEEITKNYQTSRIFFDKQDVTDYVPIEPFVNTGLNGAHLKSAQVQFQGQTKEPVVGIKFNNEGKKLFEEITKKNLNKVVAIYLDGELISAPRVQSIITTGDAVITGGFRIDEAKQLARRLNAGALPVPIELISQQTVGATLGAESVSNSLNAGLIGLIFIALFMIFMYRIPGLVSIIALGFYGIILLALFKLIGITLTLAGLAGVVLSIGMAVDANVLIFERLKEELRTGKPYQSAVDEAFKRAWTSIRDGNMSTIITTIILGWFATSFIKGFALTLGIGVILSMFSAIVITRVLMKIIANKKLVKKMPFLYLVKKR